MTVTYEDVALTSTKTFDGWDVYLGDRKVAQDMSFDPITGQVPFIDKGYEFRSPKITDEQLRDALESLEYANQYDLRVKMVNHDDHDPYPVAHVTLQEKEDASSFAFSNLDSFQKWSKELEDAEHDRLSQEPKEIVFDEIGVAKDVEITVTTLGD